MVMAPLQHHEEIVGIFVLVPDEFPFELYNHQVMAVELADRSRLPVVRERLRAARRD
jgi:hypothetical protein